MAQVPGVDAVWVDLAGAGQQEGVENGSSRNLRLNRRANCVRILFRSQRHDRYFAYDLIDQNACNLGTLASAAGHTRQDCVHFRERMGSTSSGYLGGMSEKAEAWQMVRMIGIVGGD